MLGINTMPTIALISSIFLLQFVSIIRSSQPCPTNCTCSSLENSLLSATCNQFPHLEEFNDDLHVLKIDSTEICPISKYLPKFTQLNTLSISNCAIDLNSNSFKYMTHLHSVTLFNTSIINFDPSLFEFNQNLKIVNLSSNPLKIWRHFLVSASIEVVDLSNCSLSEIPKKTFSQILNLKRLILKGNWLKTFNVILPNSINFLDLSDNRFEDVFLRALKPLTNLKEIDISNNPLVCSCKLKLIEKYLSFKNVSIIKPIKCLTQTKENILLDQVSLRDVCKLRATLDENVFVAKLFQRLRRSVATTSDSFEEFNPGKNQPEKTEWPKENIENSPEQLNSKESGNAQAVKQNVNRDHPDHMVLDEEFAAGKSHGGGNLIKPPTQPGGVNQTNEAFTTVGPGDTVDPEGGSSFFSLRSIIMLLAFVITLLLVMVIAIVTAIILKMMPQDTEETLKENGDNEGDCGIPMLSRRSSTRKGTCKICPSTMSSRRSRMSCRCNNLGGEISDVETVANESQFDCSNMTSACTTFERPRRC